MLTVAVFMTVCVTLCISVSPSQGDTLSYCGDVYGWTSVDIKTNDDIYDIAVSQHTGNIYIALHIILHAQHNLLILKDYKSKTKETVKIYALSIAVDNYLPNIYIGTSNGLSIYNELTGSIDNVPHMEYGVWKLFIPKNSKDVYAVTWYDNKVQRYSNMFAEKTNLSIYIHDWIEFTFVVDLEGNYFYTTQENGYCLTKIHLKENKTTVIHNDDCYRALAVDNAGRVYGTSYTDLKVYYLKLDGTTQSVVKLNFIPWRMCFDTNSNLVFGTKDNQVVILRLNKKSLYAELTDTETTSDVTEITTEMKNINNQ